MRRSASEVSASATGALRAGSTFTLPPARNAEADGELLFANCEGGGGRTGIAAGEEVEGGVGWRAAVEAPSNLDEVEDDVVAVRFVNRESAAVRHEASV